MIARLAALSLTILLLAVAAASARPPRSTYGYAGAQIFQTWTHLEPGSQYRAAFTGYDFLGNVTYTYFASYRGVIADSGGKVTVSVPLFLFYGYEEVGSVFAYSIEAYIFQDAPGIPALDDEGREMCVLFDLDEPFTPRDCGSAA